VMIDEGGRAGATAYQRAMGHRFLLTLDIPAGGRSGQGANGYVTSVAVIPRQLTLTISARRRMLDWKEGQDQPDWQVLLTTKELSIESGLAGVHHFDFKPAGPGLYDVKVEARDPKGALLCEPVEQTMVIDGAALKGAGEHGRIWTMWTQRLPELHLRGSWEEIGGELARQNLLTETLRAAPPDGIRFYEKHSPYYARLLKGAAKARGVPVEKLTASASVGNAGDGAPPRNSTACMDLFVNGPDGPITLFSKEREDGDYRGLAYCKVVPDAGYRYHMYTLNYWTYGYGVNSVGLMTSGATMNCSQASGDAAKAKMRPLPAGSYAAPLAMHMLLATCRTVEEAVAFLDSPAAPADFTGNKLIIDASGKAVALNGAGRCHYFYPVDGRERFAVGNYPVELPDNPFKLGDNWGWAANTKLREKAVRRYLEGRDFKCSLRDAFIIMDGQNEPGNMNQLTYENPGLLYSVASIVMVSRTGDLYLSDGPPHLTEYVKYRLGD
jgi:hypothetical protein